jgi:hypothetical protein
MLDDFKARKFRKLKGEIREILEDISEAEHTLNSVQKFFIEAVCIYAESNDLDNPLFLDSKKDSSEEGFLTEEEGKELFSNRDSPVRNLYRDIVRESHPDKQSDKPESSKEKLSELCVGANKAKKDLDLFSVFETAKELKLKFKDLNFTHVELLERQLAFLKKKLDLIYNSYPWIYFFSGETKRARVLKCFFEQNL